MMNYLQNWRENWANCKHTETRTIKDPFWNNRIEVIAEKTLPSMYNLLVKTGRWAFFDLNWRHLQIQPHIFWDSDIAKFLEAVCFAMKYTSPSNPMFLQYHKWAKDIVAMAKKAQEQNGYLNTYYIQMRPGMQFTNVMEHHELYCCGHLIEAAVAHHEATNSMEFVDIMCRYVDLICDTFGAESHKKHGYPGHQEIELALVKLVSIVPEPRYFELLEYFITQRGYNNGEFFTHEQRKRGVDPDLYIPVDSEGDLMWPEPKSYWYYQAQEPVAQAMEVKGHSVRQMYFLTGVQGLALIKNEPNAAVRRLFDNMVDKKLYIHGGIGAVGRWEGFGDNYYLPWDGYSETCASIGLVFLCERMLYGTLDRKVSLTMERALYNNILGGVSISGRAYYYDQPITGTKGLQRQTWFLCSCCPPNVARLFNSLEKYLILLKDDSLAIHLYIGCKIATKDVSFEFESKYPKQGCLKFKATTNMPIAISIREPLTAYTCTQIEYEKSNGYLTFGPRKWDNEIIEIQFEIPVVIVTPNAKVEANIGCLAVERGPYVYAIEESDSPVGLDDIEIMPDQEFETIEESYDTVEFTSLVTRVGDAKLKFKPYFVTGNEHPGEDFRIWVKDAGL